MAVPAASRQRIAEALSRFQIPFPLTVETLHQAIKEQRERPLILHQEPFPTRNQPCGLWWPDSEGNDHVWINPQAVGVQGVQSLAHELGHMLLEHPPLKVSPATAPEPEPEEEPTFKWLTPDFLDGSFLGVRNRSRDARRDPTYLLHEDEAETFGAMLRRQALKQSRDRHNDPLLDRLHASL
ncbi:hypothetical protein ACFYZ9_33580 [Streptomyces sp. NPDC001691]|uniref:hypothetical protein n=1 Tax=Streptomyces sp. NPDC001691 TaxID=3364600 RepID=UPI0036BBA748